MWQPVEWVLELILSPAFHLMCLMFLSIGLLERENATVINACLRDLAAHIVAAFRSALGFLWRPGASSLAH